MISCIDSSGLARQTKLYLLEAVYKSSDDARDSFSSCLISLGFASADVRTWQDFLRLAGPLSDGSLQTLLDALCRNNPHAMRVCCVERDFDCLDSEYAHLLTAMEPGWVMINPEKVLQSILSFCESLDIPRIKLRLLLEYVAPADGFDSNDFHLLERANEEIDATIKRLPDNAMEVLSGRWFYKDSIQRFREFMKEAN